MNSDIRLSIGFWQHPKTRKLVRKGGLEVVRSLQILWCFCAQERTNGVLSGMDIDDIEIAADWQGEPGKFVELLLKGNWMEKLDDSTYALHGWEERQAFVSKAESRKAQAKAAAESRWREKRGTPPEMPLHAPGMSDSCPPHMPIFETAYADSCGEHCSEHKNSCSEHEKQCAEHENFMLTHAQGDAPIPIPIPNPIPEENTPPNNDLRIKQDARVAQTVPEGGGIGEEGIEFMELRQAYDREGRKEAPLAGFEEYKTLKKNRLWPGLGQIHHALESLARNDEQWRAGKAPGLAKFLREQWWRMEPRSRSSPPVSAPSTLAERNLKTVQQVLKAESGDADAGH